MLPNTQYKFKTGRTPGKLRYKPHTIPVIKPGSLEPPPGLIQGTQAKSKEEWRVALALGKLQIAFEYQYQIFGGYGIRGGQIIDFLAYTVPLITPIYVLGEYWHKTRQSEGELKLLMEQVKMYFNGQANDPVGIWDYDLQTAEQAFQTVRKELRL